jgi:hypothetical protein
MSVNDGWKRGRLKSSGVNQSKKNKTFSKKRLGCRLDGVSALKRQTV